MRSIAICLFLLLMELVTVVSQQGNATSNTTAPAPSAPPSSMTPAGATIPAPVPDRACYFNLTEIDDKNQLKSPFEVETFVLCPDTVYPIGSFGPNNVVVDGYVPLRPRSNTIYSCGEDGRSSNNCTFSGGVIQVLSMFSTYNFENKVGIVLKGITFVDAVESGAVLVAPGDITFIDCVFSVRTYLFVISHWAFFTNRSVSRTIQIMELCKSYIRTRKLVSYHKLMQYLVRREAPIVKESICRIL
jgi:hypothetical protein